MEQYIPKSVLLAEIEKKKKLLPWGSCASQISMECNCKNEAYDDVISLLDTIEVKGVSLMMHTIIAECCDWRAMNTNLSHDEIEGCRNLMLTVKEEQFKAQKGEKV